MSPSTARKIFAFALVFLVLVQLALFVKIGNGLSPFDGYDEADAIRSGEAYAAEGFTLHHSLPRLLYGNRFPQNGTLNDHLDTNGLVKLLYRQGFPERMSDPKQWVYTHYPQGPNLLCGIFARCFGMERLWLWRLVPLTLAAVTLLFFFRTLVVAFGLERGALLGLGCAILPMTNTYMPGLHFEGYSYSLVLWQLGVLIRALWVGGLRPWHFVVLGLAGFGQGWISFDISFVVAFAAVPLWLMRRAEGAAPPWAVLFWGVMIPGLAFTTAHFLHLQQVAGVLGGFRAGLAELTSTASDRSGMTVGIEQFAYGKSFAKMSYLYVRELLRLYNQHFGPLLLIVMGFGLLLAVFRDCRLALAPFQKSARLVISLAWPGAGKIWPVLLAGFGVSALWPVIMPGANVGNFHIYPRVFFLCYFIFLLALVKSLAFSRVAGREEA